MTHKVLIIEDDPDLRASIEQTLDLEGLIPISTSSFIQARRSIRSNFQGVILSDIRMPDQDGFDVLNFCTSRDPDLPVVFLTGHSDVPTAMRAIKEGAYDFLEKPCEPAHLIDTLKRALNHRALVLENRAYRKDTEERTSDADDGTLQERMEKAEKKIIENALAGEGGKVTNAAKHLGIPRNTLYDRMARLQIVAKAYRGAQ